MKESRNISQSLILNMRQAEEEIKNLQSLLKQIQTKNPLKKYTKNSYQFEIHENNILIYKSDKGIGIINNQKHKLFQAKQSLTYTKLNKYQYKKFKTKDGETISYLISGDYSFWSKKDQYGFKKTSSDHKILYRYYVKSSQNKIIFERISINPSLTYFISYKHNPPSHSFQINQGTRIQIKQGYSISYKYNSSDSYTHTNDNMIHVSKTLMDKILSSHYNHKNKIYIQNIIDDFPNTLYSKLLKELIQNNIPLHEENMVYLFLINYVRKQYNLPLLQINFTLNTICRGHSNYLILNNPKNIHIQFPNHKGFFGRTPFQRRKYHKYPHQVAEKISFGIDPIKTFIKSLNDHQWIYYLLNPRSIHLGLHSRSSQKNNNRKITVFLIGWNNRSELKEPEFIVYPGLDKNLISSTLIRTKINRNKNSQRSPLFIQTIVNDYLCTIYIYSTNIQLMDYTIWEKDKRLISRKMKTESQRINIHNLYPLKENAIYILELSFLKGNNKIITKQYRYKTQSIHQLHKLLLP